MRKWLILLSALFGTSASSAPAWTWVDANGTVHFSDTPVPGARQIEIAGAQGFGTQRQTPVRPPPRRGPQSAPAQSAENARYEAVEIVDPAEQETLHNIGGMLTVVVSARPSLQPGHRYDLVFDGQRRNLNTTSSSMALSDVYRGAHTLQVVVVDSTGAEVARSPARTFFVQQASILNRN